MIEPKAHAAPPRRLMPVLFTGVFMAALDTAVIAPALPVLRETFGLDHRASGLVMTVFILFSLCSTALMANLGDRHGRRPVYLGCVTLFAFGSLVIALAPSFTWLLVGRAIQGIGGGGIIPTASAVIGDALPPQQRARALGLMGATYGMAFVLGPPLAAVLMLAFSWQWIFLANLPIAVAVVFLGAKALPKQRREGLLPPLDWLGVLLVFGLLTMLVLGVTRVSDAVGLPGLWPWMLAAAALLLPALLQRERLVERRGGQPMVPLSLFARRRLWLAYFLTTGAGFGMGSIVFLTAVATQAHGVDRAHGGFVLLPMVLASMVGSMGSGRLLERLGTRAIVAWGFALMMVGYAGTAWLSLGLAGFLLASVPVGLGVGIAVGGALRAVALDEAPLAQRGAAQGLVNIFTSVGTLLSATVIGALADFAGGGTQGLSFAYEVVAVLLGGMLLVALALRPASRSAEAVSAR